MMDYLIVICKSYKRDCSVKYGTLTNWPLFEVKAKLFKIIVYMRHGLQWTFLFNVCTDQKKKQRWQCSRKAKTKYQTPNLFQINIQFCIHICFQVPLYPLQVWEESVTNARVMALPVLTIGSAGAVNPHSSYRTLVI